VQGTELTVNGRPRFLVLASYFDALDAASLEKDLDYLAARVDGIRVFPNWWDYRLETGCGARFSPRTLLRVSDGRVRMDPERLDRLKSVLRQARARRLVVDLSLTYETVPGLSRLEGNPSGAVCGRDPELRNEVRLSEYATALREFSKALAAPEFDHAFIDLQNEANGNWTRLRPHEVRTLAEAVRSVSADRVLSISLYDPNPEAHLELVRAGRLDLVNFHDMPRGDGWWDRTRGQVERLRSAFAAAGFPRPIYDGEPSPEHHGRGARAYAASLAGARAGGAAAWTFHTRAGFHLDDRSYEAQLDEAARAFLDGLRASRDQAPTP
jgi:hypothetical protein